MLLIEVFCFVLTTRFKWKGLVLSVGGLLVISFIVTAVIIGHYDLSVVLFGMGGKCHLCTAALIQVSCF